MPAFFLELAQWHTVFLEEPDEVLAGNAAVLAARYPVAAETTRIEPFTHRPWCNLTDFCHLAGGKDFLHGRHSIRDFLESSLPDSGRGLAVEELSSFTA